MKKVSIYLSLLTALFITNWSIAQSHYPGQHIDKLEINDQNHVKLQNFNLSNVRLLEGVFEDNMKREIEWLMSFPVKRLLHSFRTNAGVYSEYEGGHYALEPLGGWESLDCELRGHSIGHMLSGLAQLYASTGEEQFRLKGDSLVSGLAEVQKTLGESGYLSAYPENLINRNIRGERVWAPWYTLHKLYSGLIDQYLHSDNEQALEVVKGMSDWAYNKLKPLTEEQRKLMLRNEFGGVNDSFYTLYALTGNENYKWLAEFFYHNDVLDPLLKSEDILEKKHANTYIPKLIGLIRAYELGEKKDFKTIADFFWNTVVAHHSFVTGSNSDKEKFFKADHQSQHLSGYTGESCNVYNLLKLTNHLFSINQATKYADFYEKALFNHILGQQHPETGHIAYFLPMLPGAHKVYSTYDESFWCCVGTGWENHAKYGEFIYQHTDNDLYVNLFIASNLNWEKKGLKLTQKTSFPHSNTTTFSIEVDKPIHLPINIRYPNWATSIQVKINGKPTSVNSKAGNYISLSQTWKKGDSIEVTFGMELKAVPTADNPNIVAFTYGPIVLAGRMGVDNMESPAPYSNPKVRNDYYTYDYKVPADLDNTLDIKLKKLEKCIQAQSESGLNFKIKDTNITLSPIAEIHGERYVIYWNTKEK